MARVEIHLRVDPKTQRKTLSIAYESDADALAFEHEEDHRRIVQQLVERGVLGAGEVAALQIERVEVRERLEQEATAEPSGTEALSGSEGE